MNEFIIIANIFTGDPETPNAQAVYIRGNRIKAVGSIQKLKAQAPRDVRVLDLPGCLITPGLIEGHCHLTSTGLFLQNLRSEERRVGKEC